MGQVQIKLTGAKAIVAILVVAAFMGYRFFSATSTIETDAAEELKRSRQWAVWNLRRHRRKEAVRWRSTEPSSSLSGLA